MTKILFGDRELITRQLDGARLVSAPDEGIDDKELIAIWRRRKLKHEPLAILNPTKDVPKGMLPQPGYMILFDTEYLKSFKGQIPAAWRRWAQSHGIVPQVMMLPSAKQTAQVLMSGLTGVTFTREAAEWYSRVVGSSQIRLEMELNKLLTLGITEVDLEKAVAVISGSETLRAEHILRALGTQEAIRLGLEVPKEKAISLMAYLTTALLNRKNSWTQALQTIRKGADLKRFDYWTGVQMFLHYCYLSKTQDETELLLEVIDLAGTVPALSEWRNE